MAVLDDLIQALQNINGTGSLSEIYAAYGRINPDYYEPTIRRTLQQYSSDTNSYLGREDIFFSVNGIGNGVWGLRNYSVSNGNQQPNVTAQGNQNPGRRLHLGERVVRDTALARQIKRLVGHKCQLCENVITLPNGQLYSEAHHIKPLGAPYNGPDVQENILILCPNCHVKCDYKVIPLDIDHIKNNLQNVSEEYLQFHNGQYSVLITE